MNINKSDLNELQKKTLMKEKILNIAGWILALSVSSIVFFISLSFASNL